jgi:hypothetical protein
MTSQELIDQLDNYPPDAPVRLRVTHEGDGSSFTQIYEVASLEAGTPQAEPAEGAEATGDVAPETGAPDVHLVAGAAVPC